MNWKTIRLELACTQDFPSGSVSRGFLIRLPLNDNGSIDEAMLTEAPQKATVRRFWSTEPDESGRIVRVNGDWALRCNGSPDRLLSTKSLGLGEEVAVIDSDGRLLPFRVASIRRMG
jgi:hypothetical protein